MAAVVCYAAAHMGHIEAIHIASAASAPMQALREVEAVVGEGLAGDRYFTGIGFYSKRPTAPGAREVDADLVAERLARVIAHRVNLALHRPACLPHGPDLPACH